MDKCHTLVQLENVKVKKNIPFPWVKRKPKNERNIVTGERERQDEKE